MRFLISALVLGCTAAAAMAQTSDGESYDALSTSMASSVKLMSATIHRDLAEAAQSMPTDEYSFKPTPEVRTFGELIGHLASANFFFCAQVKGERPPMVTNYEKLTDKAALVKALTDSFTYCDGAYDATTDENFGSPVKLLAPKPSQARRGAVLFFNTTHKTSLR